MEQGLVLVRPCTAWSLDFSFTKNQGISIRTYEAVNDGDGWSWTSEVEEGDEDENKVM